MSEKTPDKDEGDLKANIQTHWWNNKLTGREKAEIIGEAFEKKHPTNDDKIRAKNDYKKAVGLK